MKSAVAGLIMIGTAGSLGVVLPDANAPYQVGHVAFKSGESDATDHVLTFAASIEMTQAEVMAWADARNWARSGASVVLVFAAGNPVPDPAPATNLQNALWIAQRGDPRWQIDIGPDGERQVTRLQAR